MGTAPPIRLTDELALYETHKFDWLKTNRDEFVVIKGNKVVGFFKAFHEAYSVGVEKFGLDADFLVKRVVLQEPVFVVF